MVYNFYQHVKCHCKSEELQVYYANRQHLQQKHNVRYNKKTEYTVIIIIIIRHAPSLRSSACCQ